MGSGGRGNSVLVSSDWHMKNFEGQKGFELVEARESIPDWEKYQQKLWIVMVVYRLCSYLPTLAHDNLIYIYMHTHTRVYKMQVHSE